MTIKRTPRPRDPIQLGKLMVDIATGVVPDGLDNGKDGDKPVRGRAGGRSRAGSLTPEQRAEIAKKAAAARWKVASDA